MSFTADEYRTAAKVFREEYERSTETKIVPSISELLEEKAEKVEARLAALVDLGHYADEAHGYGRWDTAGQHLADRLVEAGWTPPEVLA